MAEGTSMRENCLRMISNLNTLEVLGADIDEESQVDMILQSLPESFKEFRLNYNMNKKIYTLSELMNELIATEGILGTSSVEANVGEASTSQPKSKGKGRKKKKKNFTKQDGCTNHICKSFQGFQETRKLNEEEMFLTLADGSRIPVIAI
ncbi:uncharacterized protein LOC136068955 [Quercus suber]|uniref:uncharacterized protein LOC136068955 n=1 Tax=Quercus suber TaxID=58331 RepID=UPI0032DE9AF7